MLLNLYFPLCHQKEEFISPGLKMEFTALKGVNLEKHYAWNRTILVDNT